ncbi:MAG: 50S ribosomal protein L4 [Anaerolineaceae bacterium]|nr:50S ribosomal protein L4 [Anaerolineaceae bacterium]
MAKVDVVDITGKKIKQMELPASIFEAPVNIALMHQAFVRQTANARLGTHETKTRSNVSGGGKKPWRQKGTGRARQGSIRSAQWVGGGKIHTPHPRSYDKKMPRKMRRAAVRSALTVRATENAVILVDGFNIEEPRTKVLVNAVDKLTGGKTALVVLAEKESKMNVFLSSDNLTDVKILLAKYLNIRDLLSYDRLIFDLPAIKVMEEYLGSSKRTK